MESVLKWAVENYNPALSQAMLWPVLIFFENRQVGMGTWIQTPTMSKVLTAHHLFRKSNGEGVYTMRPLGKRNPIFALEEPVIVRNAQTSDVVGVSLGTGRIYTFTGTWDKGKKRARDQIGTLETPRQMTSLLTGEKVTMTHLITRPDGEECYLGKVPREIRDGESGSGFLGKDNSIHVALSVRVSDDGEFSLILSKAVIFG